MKTNKVIILLLLMVFVMQGCAAYMHGYTKREAMERYLLVDKESQNFGYKRMEYNLGYNRSLQGFVEKHGLPDFIYEYKNEKERESIKMFYVEKDIVYIYESQSWMADSLFLKEHRPLTDYEKATFKELKK